MRPSRLTSPAGSDGTRAVATQGLITLLDLQGRVVRKVVAGDNGMGVPRLAKLLGETTEPLSAPDLYKLAKRHIGCKDCLVIQGPAASDAYYDGAKIDADDLDAVLPLFRQHYDDPNFNPRWAHGTADHVAVITVPWSDRP